jgi:hypothetical protein
MPYTGIPRAANSAKYCAREIAICTEPIPSGPSILKAYGKLTSWNIRLTTDNNTV